MLLSPYLAHVVPTLTGGSQSQIDEAMEVFRLLGLLQSELVWANGQAVASVVSSRRHLWVSQSKNLPCHVRKAFCELPFTPGITFGRGVDDILQTESLRLVRSFFSTSSPGPRPGPIPKLSLRDVGMVPRDEGNSTRLNGMEAPSLAMASPQGRIWAPGSDPDCQSASAASPRLKWQSESSEWGPLGCWTVLREYKLQFRCQPLPFRGNQVTSVSDPAKWVVLRLEITSLVAKRARAVASIPFWYIHGTTVAFVFR